MSAMLEFGVSRNGLQRCTVTDWAAVDCKDRGTLITFSLGGIEEGRAIPLPYEVFLSYVEECARTGKIGRELNTDDGCKDLIRTYSAQRADRGSRQEPKADPHQP
jgi:hypothetical protein